MSDLKSWVAGRRESLAFAAIIATITVVYLWDISINGWSNPFYAAAVQAGSESWKAWFFGSFDPQNYITVDKPAGGLWLMGLSARIFGFSSASMLVPEALLAVASAALIRASVRRLAGPGAGLLAAAVFALVPVVSVMFRHSNPDAPMVFGMVVAAYFTVRALNSPRSRAAAGWLALSGAALGFAFLCKTLEGLLVAPALLLTYLVAARWGWKARILHVLGSAVGLVVASGWWMLAVALTPASARPYVSNSTDNSEWSLAIGYNGLDRLLGDNSGGPADGPMGEHGNFGFGGPPGILRLFQGDQADHIAWLLPAALIALILGLIIASRTGVAAQQISAHDGADGASRTRRILGELDTRARALVNNPAGVALILWGTWLVSNYLVLSYMAKQFHPYYTSAMAPAVAGTVAVGTALLWRHRDEPIGRYGLAAVTLSAAVMAWVLLRRDPDWHPELRWILLIGGILVAGALALGALQHGQRLRIAVAALALAVSLGGSLSFTLANVTTPKTGGLSTSGPARPDNDRFGGGGGGGGGGGDDKLDPDLTKLFKDSDARWVAATTNTRTAAPIELSADVPVMAIGGFSGRDNPITLAQFIDYTKNGEVRYFVTSENEKNRRKDFPGDDNKTNVANQVEEWVKAHFTPTDHDDLKVYDLAGPTKP